MTTTTLCTDRKCFVHQTLKKKLNFSFNAIQKDGNDVNYQSIHDAFSFHYCMNMPVKIKY
jgi:hypothetical protein